MIPLPALFVVLLVVVSAVLCFPLHEEVNPEHTVIVFGFSGLPWNSMDRYSMPALERLKREGVHVHRKHDPFQTESLPAFVTMVTGLYPDSHGMLSNKMKDLKSRYRFDVNGDDPIWWKDVKPIWIRNGQSGNKSALCYWPGHHIAFNGKKAEYNCAKEMYVDPFVELTTNGEISKDVMPFEERVDKVKYWLTLSNRTERPSFIGVYFEEPLKSMMKYGTNSNETRDAVAVVDNITNKMMDFLIEKGLHDKVNFVVTGESGAIDISQNGEIFLNDYLQDTEFARSYEIIDNGPITTINPTFDDSNKTKEFLDILKNASDAFTAYDGSKLPEEFHYTKKYRTMPIILVANESMRINHERSTVSPNKALVGYNGKYVLSNSLLIARGPAFKESFYLEHLPNVDIYNMFCKALKIKPDKNSGNEESIQQVFAKPSKWYVVVYKNVVNSPFRFTVAIIVALILLFTALYLTILSISKATEKCRCLVNGPRRLDVFTPNKAFRNTADNDDGDAKHLLDEDESEESDLDEDLHFHMQKDSNSK